MYSIGQISEMFGLPISTLRYYDKQGLFPGMERKSGIRKFGEKELETLRVIEKIRVRNQGHQAVYGLVCRRTIHLRASEGIVCKAKKDSRSGNRTHE